jgi:hypothetical protein
MIATKIKRIILAEPSIFSADITSAATAKTLIDAAIAAVTAGTAEDVSNVHGETWQINESEASMNSYKNELDGSVYRRDLTPGDLSIQFTMGDYSEKLKAAVRGGEVITKGGEGTDKDTVIGYKGDAAGSTIKKAMLCLTQDGFWFIYPKATIAANTNETDNAALLAVKGYPEKPSATLSTEYNINSALI